MIAILLELLLELGPVNFSKPLPHSRLGLEARVGIGRLMPVFREKLTIFAEQFQYTLSLFGLTDSNSLTEEFTEGYRYIPTRAFHHERWLLISATEAVSRFGIKW